ncbi:unnamed protein product [Linum tenue]|uniref:ABC transporter B family member 26, chloroplastic n=1 Tax=Linum tenue TaxID=586396 RepID=A0AAV0ND12_9ROSI|nr:unnamed protein product [Linum tenue]
MAASRLNLQLIFLPSNSARRTVTVAAISESHFKVHFPSTSRRITRYRGLEFRRQAFSSLTCEETKYEENFSNNSRNPFELLLSILTGGSWWRLPDNEEGGPAANEVTVLAVLQRMWELLGKEQWIVVVAFGALVTAAASEITMPSILASSIFSAQHGDKTVFYSKSRFLLVLCFTSGISSGLRSGLFAMANVILVKRLRQALYSALISQDMPFFDREKVGGLTSRLGADCQQLSNVIGNNIHLIVRNTFQGVGALINLLILAWPLALSSIITCLVLATIFLLYGRYQKEAAKLTQDLASSASKAADETLSSIRTIRVYGTECEELGRQYRHWLEKLASLSLRESVAYGFWNMSFSTLFRATQVFALMLGGMSIMAGRVSTEQLTKYVLYCEWLIYATWRVVDNTTALLRAVGSSERVFHLMQLSQSDQLESKGERLERLIGQVQFVDVSFIYPSRPTIPILENFHLSVKANEVIALVGPSGSGKTTLVNLLLRLYEPSNGQIYIDEFPLTELDIRWLRENIGYVGQEPKLFHMDVKSNITYGSCGREIKEEEVERAAKLACAHDFILSLPNGYETMVNDNSLSGGQKQRIAIARAIIRKPSILILDEATSALDSQTENFVKGIVDACKNDGVMSETTVIVIAHRLSTVESADRIVVMDGGRIVEMGGHKELLLKNGTYSRLVKLQSCFIT